MSGASSIAAATPRTPRAVAALAERPLWLALAVVAVVTAFRLSGTVDSDVAWQLWIAGRIHAGANLYTDIIETNPPLWFWMALPIDRLSALLDVRVEAVLVAAIGSLAALSILATHQLLAVRPLRSRRVHPRLRRTHVDGHALGARRPARTDRPDRDDPLHHPHRRSPRRSRGAMGVGSACGSRRGSGTGT